MCCCKWCQYYLESIYWHCIEKHFCFDENIALYDDEEAGKTGDASSESNAPSDGSRRHNGGAGCKASNNNIYDNMAFYDNVAMIANRSIFIIEPKASLKTPPSAASRRQHPRSSRSERSLHREIFLDDDAKAVITEQPTFSVAGSASSLDPSRSEPELAPEPRTPQKREADTFRNIPLLMHTNATSLSSLATISEDHEAANPHLLTIPHSATSTALVKMRKKSLHERRVSKSLTLDIDGRRQEVPIIRQSSFPKFYIDTPEANQNASSIAPTPIQALETPVVPNTFKFDLQTVVQLQNERHEQEIQKIQLRRSATSVKDTRRIQQIRDKLKPIKLLRNASLQSLHSSNA